MVKLHWSKRLLVILAAVLLLTLAVGGSYVYASWSKTVPAEVRITVTPSFEVAFYTDAACTQPCTMVAFKTLSPGGTDTVNFYAKNTGNTAQRVALRADIPASIGTVQTRVNDQDLYNLTPGEVATLTARLTIASSVASSMTTYFNLILASP